MAMQQMPTSTTSEFGRGGPHSTIDLLALFWRRRAYLIVCMLLGIFLGALYCGMAMPVYESVADVLVVQKRPQAVTGDHQYESGFEDYLATHLAVVVSPLIVERAIEASDLGSLACFADLEDPEEDLVDTIIGNLEVESGSRDLGENADSIMTLAYRCSVPEDCPIVVQALLDSYEAFHDEVYRGMSDNTVSLIRQARDLLTKDLAQQEESYSTFRQTSPLVARGTDEVNPLQDRLTAIEVQRSDLLLRKAEIEWQLLALEQAQQDGVEAQRLLAMVTELRQQATTENGVPTTSAALENQLIQLMDNERALLEHYGPNHPHMLTMRQRISDTRRLFALPISAHMSVPESGDALEASSTNQDPVAVYTQYLQQELKRLKISEGLLTVLYDHEHEAAKEHSIFQLKDERFQRSIQRTEALYDVVISRLQEASLIKDFGGFETRVIGPPTLGMKVGPSRKIIFPAAALAGILLGCMLAMVVELRDDSFQSCEQIQQQLGLPVVGQIPQFAAARKSHGPAVAGDVALDPMLCSYHGPRSSSAESFRTLRTALYFNSLGESSRVIQVSGAGTDDGASTVAANLAISLAQTGKRVLLIDADLGKQGQHKMFGIDRPKTGLAAIVTSDVEPTDAICQTAVENLWLLPAGLLPEGPCELFTSPRFGELINLVRDSYDHVLIDTEPLLVASDPAVIASHTDGVVLTLGLARDSRQRAMRAKQLLQRLDVSVLGIVVNRLNGAFLKRHQVERRDYARSLDVRPSSVAEPAVG
jgi:succinoglycan biosynthesis transport protein ExoP